MAQKKKISALTAFALAAALALSACGGGGGGGGGGNSASGSDNSSSGTGSSGGSSSGSASTGNVTTPQYANASAQATIFNTINAQRQQCGFPALTENTLLDQAAQAHADYIGSNGGLITDDEISGNPGFTGVSYTDRATHAGYPTNTKYASGESAGYYTNASLSETSYGTNIINEWMGGVYHIAVIGWPITEVGIGWNETPYNGFPEAHGVVEIGNLQPMAGNLPLTFPCQGSTGIPYSEGAETPMPPNTSGAFGTPIDVTGNPTDTIVLQSATVTDNSGTSLTLQVLNSSTDPNKLLPQFEAVAYPTAPLKANTVYTVSLTGTRNGVAFSRAFSFTTASTAYAS
jgi:uncharacterized protein YkwD